MGAGAVAAVAGCAPALAGAVLPAAGRRSAVPESTHEVGLRPLAAASAAVETPWRAAIAPSESPGRTMYEPAAAAGAAAVAAVACPRAGIVSVVPATTRASGARPLAAATALAGRLLAIAMPHRVSPGATVCVAAAAVAGASAQTTSAAERERASMDVAYHGRGPEDRPRAVFREPASDDAPAILWPDDRRAGPAVVAEVALVRAQRPAVEPRPDPLGVRAPRGVRPLAGARQRARGAARGPPGDRPQHAARARRMDHRAGRCSRADRRGHVPEPRRDGGQRRARGDRLALHAGQRLLRDRRQPPLRRPRTPGDLAGVQHER